MEIRARSAWTYVGIAVIFAASYALASVLPAGAVLQSIAANVGVVALIGALFQLFRDQAAHEKEVWLRRDAQHFEVGVTSHMSNVVFDRHLAFCEEYMPAVHAAVDSLLQRHATDHAVDCANNLYIIRRRHATWVTTEMSKRLSGFEDAVRQIGAKGHFIEAVREQPDYAVHRQQAIDFVYAELRRILPQYFGEQPVDGISSETIEERVREMLGIQALVELRTAFIARAHANLPRN